MPSRCWPKADLPRVTVELPRLVSQLTGAPHGVGVNGADTAAVLAALVEQHPGVRAHLLDDNGAVRVNVLGALDGERTRLAPPAAVRDGSVLRFVGSVAGG